MGFLKLTGDLERAAVGVGLGCVDAQVFAQFLGGEAVGLNQTVSRGQCRWL